MAFLVFFPSLVRFPLFSLCRSLFSFVNSLCLSLFFSLLLLACWRCGGAFIGQKGAGTSLLLPYSSAWGAGLCCPATALGWLANGWGWHGAAPLFFHYESSWGGGFGRHVAWERGKKQNFSFFPCCTFRGRRKRNSVVQNDTVLVLLLLLFFLTWNGVVLDKTRRFI